MVPSLYSSVGVVSWCVRGEGNWALLLFRGVVCNCDEMRSDRRGFFTS